MATLSHLMTDWLLLFLYFLLAPFVWGFFGFAIINGRGKMEILKRPKSPVPIRHRASRC